MSEEEDIAGIYQGRMVRSLTPELRTDFKPWHKPRKHYLRLKQWCRETQKLIRELRLVEGDELRYFGLPGEDLLDIWALRQICEDASIKLRYVGFDSSRRSVSANLASHKVNTGKFIHPSSIVLGDPLSSILRRDSPGFLHVDRNAPYAVINLDLCDSVVSYQSADSFPNMDVVRLLLDTQIKRCGHPWILFLTSKVERRGMTGEKLRRIFHCVVENINAGRGFAGQLEGQLGISPALLSSATDSNQFDDHRWMHCHTLAFAKWLLAYLVEKQCSATLLDSYFYNVNGGQKDMISLGFRIEPAPVIGRDRSGLTQEPAVQPIAVDEDALACALLPKIASMPDVDAILADDVELLERFLEKKATLLAGVGYDPQEYRRWAVGHEDAS